MKKNILSFLVFIFGVSVSFSLFAQTPGFLNPSTESSIPEFIKGFYDFALMVGGVLAVGAIVVGGIMYSISGAVDKKNSAKGIIAGALWGLLLLLGSYVILRTVNPELVNLEAPELPEAEFSQCTEKIVKLGNGVEVELPRCEGLNEWPIDFETGECKCYVDGAWVTEYNQIISTVENEPNPHETEILPGSYGSKGQSCLFQEFGGNESLFQKAKRNGGRDVGFEKENMVTVKCMGVSLLIHKKAADAFRVACSKIPSDAKIACGRPVKPQYNLVIRKIRRTDGGEGKNWSPHSWGIAVDFNPWECGYCDNANRKSCNCKPNLPASVINAFKSTPGFRWGGDYKDKCDNMHFEWFGPCLN